MSGVTREYYMSTSSSELAGSSWSTEIPTLGDNKYLWYRDKFTLTNGSVATTTPICDGAWEAIYNIYGINENITSYVEDVETLKTDVESLETEIQPIERGGTGAITKAAAMETLCKLGTVDGDSISAWRAAGYGIMTVSSDDTRFPVGGTLINLVGSSIASGNTQVLIDGSYTYIYVRHYATLSSKWMDWECVRSPKTEISLTRNKSNTPSESTYTCRYVESDKRVYLRAVVFPRESLTYNEDTTYTLYTVPEKYRPKTNHTLSACNGGGGIAQAIVRSDGSINLFSRGGTITKSFYIYITGWWDI